MGVRRFIPTSVIVGSLLLAAPELLYGQCSTTGASSTPPLLSKVNVRAAIVDRVLQREWKIVVDCDHPERPGTMIEVPFVPGTLTAPNISQIAGALAIQQRPDVAQGSPVVVRRTDSQTHTELEGTSVRSGRIGERIPVRLANGVLVEGRVSGTALIELELPQGVWWQP